MFDLGKKKKNPLKKRKLRWRLTLKIMLNFEKRQSKLSRFLYEKPKKAIIRSYRSKRTGQNLFQASTTDEKLHDDTGLDGKHLNKQEKDKKKDTKLDDSETGSQQIIIENELKLEKEKKDTKQPKKSNELIHNKQIKNDKKKQIKQDEIRGLHSNQIIDNDLKLEKVKKKEERLKLAEETLKREFRNKALEKQQEKLRREEIQKKKNF